jgi:hypothetical protein
MTGLDWAPALLCVDCTMLHANGELPDTVDTARLAALQAVDRHYVVGEEFAEFSPARCDSCGTTAAGYRNHGTVEVAS